MHHTILDQLGITQWRLRDPVNALSNNPADFMLIIDTEGPADTTLALLDKMLAAIGQSRQSVYLITLESGLSLEHYRSSLLKKIEQLKPRLILSLSLSATHSLLENNAPLAALRAQTLIINTIPLIASFAPHHLLNNQSDKRAAFQDLLRVQALLTE